MNFDEAFDRLIGHEAGFSKDPKDPGNWTGGKPGVGVLKGTKFGIAANTYPDIDIENLTLATAKAIYKRDWWLKIGADEIDGAIIFQLWDFAVNAGMGNAKRALQRAVRVADDGKIGAMTIAAVKAMSVTDVLMRFNAQRLRHYTSLSTWPTFGKGWTNRVAGNLDYAAEDS
ncbi:glycoside hydrolase family 108 protein [Herminiimonas contaminans]|uniref:Secretion activator protein n=1 Tax=Herminiimonas contaminans TaxID=1111140 RepID=A0ABS0ESS3_9BURK|nr:glycosyl hydrolase 108 family protein [Herminiimonas contaminans]MBF8177799.1 secretion activator protein [Herminiimonas contaminans]